MRDYVVEILYQDINDETQQELFEVSAKSKSAAEKCVVDILTKEGARITYIKTN